MTIQRVSILGGSLRCWPKACFSVEDQAGEGLLRVREKVLLVEDNLGLVEIVRKYLRVLGYEVSVATTGTQGVQMAIAQIPDVIILDIMLPEIDGLEVASQLRRHPQTCFLPILAITANTDFRMKIKAQGAGCDAFFHKPFTISRLASAIEKLLKSKAIKDSPLPPH